MLGWRGGLPVLTDPGLFLAALLDRIEANWRQAQLISTTRPSRENWRFTRRTHIDPANASPEVTLERAVAALSPAWANQIPIASGLTGPSHDRVRNVDLAHCDGPGEYTLYELKVAADTPLYAAVEILVRGLVYVFTRRHMSELGYDPSAKEVLAAHMVRLRVLAPTAFYAGIDLAWLEEALNHGLAYLTAAAAPGTLALDFAFLAFPPAFGWPGGELNLEQAIAGIQSVYRPA